MPAGTVPTRATRLRDLPAGLNATKFGSIPPDVLVTKTLENPTKVGFSSNKLSYFPVVLKLQKVGSIPVTFFA